MDKEQEIIQYFKALNLLGVNGLESEFLNDLRNYEKLYGLPGIVIDN
ncbi:hypothetical protein RV11_GL000069 [Enterococcus phoeniculicola]|jgi:hypothetical protein|nr:hypothetical protein [Enterococcus phoeniculicola]OJG73703.1 hypothetical protein RV11_GL000069 [Enterococcus phoeniculicola]